MKKILICSDSFKRISGLSYVALNIAKYFSQKDYEVIYCCLTGEDSKIDDLYNKGHFFYENLFDMKVYNYQTKKQDSYTQFNSIIENHKPNIVFSIHDLWQFENIAFSTYRDTYTWVAYCPIESHYYPEYITYPTYFDKRIRKSLSDICQNMDYAFAYNSVGFMQLKNLKANVVDSIPNGLDDYFFDISEVNRQAVFKGTIREDDFVFMTVGHNFQRKGIDYVIEAFNGFLKYFNLEDKQKYKLYIHGFLDTVDAGTDIKSLVYNLGLSNNVIMSQTNQITKRDLYKRYKCSDCYIGLPLAEGYGYGFMEAQINALPIIFHNVGGINEYINSQNVSISSSANMYPNNYACIWKIPNIQETINYMLRVACDIKFMNNESTIFKNNFKEAKKYEWKHIYKKLDELFQNINIQEDIFNKLSIRRII